MGERELAAERNEADAEMIDRLRAIIVGLAEDARALDSHLEAETALKAELVVALDASREFLLNDCSVSALETIDAAIAKAKGAAT
jgi:hypothetical protein